MEEGMARKREVSDEDEEELKNIFAEEMMTNPELVKLSLQREEGYEKLSPEQQAIVSGCRLKVRPQSALLGMIKGSHSVITGTTEEGRKVKIIFDIAQSWEMFAEATVDGKEVSKEEALKLRDKYRAIAEFQTKESISTGEYKYNELMKRTKEERDSKKLANDTKVLGIRARIMELFS